MDTLTTAALACLVFDVLKLASSPFHKVPNQITPKKEKNGFQKGIRRLTKDFWELGSSLSLSFSPCLCLCVCFSLSLSLSFERCLVVLAIVFWLPLF